MDYCSSKARNKDALYILKDVKNFKVWEERTKSAIMAEGLDYYLTKEGIKEAEAYFKEKYPNAEHTAEREKLKEMYKARDMIVERLSPNFTPQGYSDMHAHTLWADLGAQYKPRGVRSLMSAMVSAFDVSLQNHRNNPQFFMNHFVKEWKDVEEAARANGMTLVTDEWKKCLFLLATRLPQGNDPWRAWRDNTMRRVNLPEFNIMLQDFYAGAL